MTQALLSKICDEILGVELIETGLGCKTYRVSQINPHDMSEKFMKK